MLKLSQKGKGNWEFVYPDIYGSLRDEFHRGCELYEDGKLDEAEAVFRAVLAQMPDHLDAIHHLAIVQSERQLLGEALDLWNQAVSLGRKAFPKDFRIGKGRLEWGWLDNRPFLRCLHGLALAVYERGEIQEALKLFQELLSLKPSDNVV